jgi:hypothetical protein
MDRHEERRQSKRNNTFNGPQNIRSFFLGKHLFSTNQQQQQQRNINRNMFWDH